MLEENLADVGCTLLGKYIRIGSNIIGRYILDFKFTPKCITDCPVRKAGVHM
jgi:hypothetical protein